MLRWTGGRGSCQSQTQFKSKPIGPYYLIFVLHKFIENTLFPTNTIKKSCFGYYLKSDNLNTMNGRSPWSALVGCYYLKTFIMLFISFSKTNSSSSYGEPITHRHVGLHTSQSVLRRYMTAGLCNSSRKELQRQPPFVA